MSSPHQVTHQNYLGIHPFSDTARPKYKLRGTGPLLSHTIIPNLDIGTPSSVWTQTSLNHLVLCSILQGTASDALSGGRREGWAFLSSSYLFLEGRLHTDGTQPAVQKQQNKYICIWIGNQNAHQNEMKQNAGLRPACI